MDKKQAINIVRATFESSFDKRRFTNFIKNLLNEPDLTDGFGPRSGNYIPDSFKGYVEKYERLGKYEDSEEKRVDLLIVYLKKEMSIERARSMQRNFVAGYLQGKFGSDTQKDAALVAFVAPKEEDWRFSLVKLEVRLDASVEGKIKVFDEFTPAKRWSFLVGSQEKSHTAQTQFVPIMEDTENNPTLVELEEAFNIEKVTKEFFEKYRGLFIWTKDELDKAVKRNPKTKADFESKGIDTVNLAKKLLGQIIFLYYLQKKGWFGVPSDAAWGEGSRDFLRELFEKCAHEKKNFFNDYLEPLFYEALRLDRSHDDHYYSRFDCKIPFLNGGLFDPMNNYDWVKTEILLSNDLFSNKKKINEVDTGDGILDIFDRYNFTVKEDEPFEKEVAIDPELLGKAYEKFNAIRPDNYKEFLEALKSGKKGDESKFNKQYGVYYTPREIVHYMCQQSLINYLYSELNPNVVYQNLGDDQLDMFGNAAKGGQMDMTVEHRPMTEVPKEDISMLIQHGENWRENEARVDAAGKETDTYSYRMPESIRNNASLLDEKLAAIKVCDPAVGSGAFPVGMMSEIVKARQALRVYQQTSEFFKNSEVSTAYDFKRQCIENSLYGVDIDSGAVEIAKLRLWLSLVVDEDDPQNIKPLPNLDYKIIQGNSLLGIPVGVLLDSKIQTALEERKQEYLYLTNPTKKIKVREEINELFVQLVQSAKQFDPSLGYVDFDFRTHFSEVFHDRSGFDVIIANPPYVSNKKMHKNKMQDEISIYKKLFFSMKSGNADIYVLFVEKSLSILKKQGAMRLIIPNKFLIAKYSKAILEYVIKNRYLTSVDDLSNISVFESASVYPIIIELEKSQNDVTRRQLFTINNSVLQVLQEKEFNYKDLTLEKLQSTKEEQPLVDKITNQSSLLGDELEVSPGINGFQFTNYGKCVFDKGEKSIGKAKYKKLVISGSIDRYIIKKEPIRYNKRRLLDPIIIYDAEIISPGKWELFEHPKIVIAGMATKIEAQYDENGELAPGVNVYSIYESGTLSFKYILAYLNSQLASWLFRTLFYDKHLGGDYISINATLIRKLPIKVPTLADQKPYVRLVERVLAAKGANPQADTSKLESEIDQLVYQLYGLTQEEIDIVEGK